jgi:NAD(P)-dependent dehydrogenase (short-subunit alcohol dehydrogenase family)
MRKTAILTGAYGAIGKAIAEGVAEKGYRLIMLGRDRLALEEARKKLINKIGNEQVEIHALDLSRESEICSLANEWVGPLHLLINNAAATPRTRQETPEGIEMQFATNVLGYFWMIKYFSPFMEGQPDARIVNVASYWAGDLRLDDLEFKKRPYHNDTAYRQTKQADRMLTAAFARRLQEKHIAVLAAHPGDVNSKLSNNLGYGGWEFPEQGASTPLYCATDPDLKGLTGKYFEHRKETPCQFAADHQSVEKLFELCEMYCRMPKSCK